MIFHIFLKAYRRRLNEKRKYIKKLLYFFVSYGLVDSIEIGFVYKYLKNLFLTFIFDV